MTKQVEITNRDGHILRGIVNIPEDGTRFPAEIPYCITDSLIRAAKGDVEEALLFCGADAYRQTRMETVKEVIDSLF